MKFLAILGLGFALASCGNSGVANVELPAGDAAEGASLFSTNCASCHGTSATGDSGPSLLSKSAATMQTTVRNGEGSMSAFTTADLSDQDLADIIAYVDTL